MMNRFCHNPKCRLHVLIDHYQSWITEIKEEIVPKCPLHGDAILETRTLTRQKWIMKNKTELWFCEDCAQAVAMTANIIDAYRTEKWKWAHKYIRLVTEILSRTPSQAPTYPAILEISKDLRRDMR